MRRHTEIASQILLILSIFNFVLAAPIAVQERNEVHVNAVDIAKVGMVASEKRMDPGDRFSTNAGALTVEWNTISSDGMSGSSSEGDTATSRETLIPGSPPGPVGSPPRDQFSTNAGYLTEESVIEWNTISSDSTTSGSSSEVDTAASRQTSSTGLPPGPAGNPPPSQPGPAGNPLPSQSGPASNPPPSQPGPAGNPPPSHPPPSAEAQHLESGNFFDKFMKGKFKRHISGYGAENVVEGVARYH